ncbi:unnamed protein product [Sphagnum balticum]
MDDEERSRTVEVLTRIINDEMGLREQLEIIRILNPDTKLKPTDTQFVIGLKMIDDEKFRRIKERELRIKRAHQRFKLRQKKEQRQLSKATKSGLFSHTETVKLSRVLPEQEFDVDILS